MISTASTVSGLFLLLGIVSFPERMGGGVQQKPFPASDRQRDLARRDLRFFREPDPEFVNPIAEQIGLGAAKFVPQCREAHELRPALRDRLHVAQTLGPLERRDRSIL